MKVYVFGNQDLPGDNYPIYLAKKLESDVIFKNILKPGHAEMIYVKPNEDIPFADSKNVILMDTVVGIEKPMILDESFISKMHSVPRTSVHDFDLGFQLKYLTKLGKLKDLKIIGLPLRESKKVTKDDYFLIQSIFKKLVAQDMQGS